ncbi:hypothetical protein [Kaistella pullorum]|uniref:Uncharacterized protein n=1 Tax=Kaistella pullorum TaxID=2763074 RepID=A0ABR8WKA3_9FLAO|nr:hypothetical protein [Kaistella pullorum]MBD8017450.1 hypothetical protein [Kaistella pullorum]
MTKLTTIALLYSLPANSQVLIHHTPQWFGPNANPVPEFTAAVIPAETKISRLQTTRNRILYPVHTRHPAFSLSSDDGGCFFQP